MRMPEIYTSRYFAEDVLRSGELVPVRVSMHPPIIPVPVEEVAELLLPQRHMLTDWSGACFAYWKHLDHVGAEAIMRELAEISQRHGGLGLLLVDYEDVRRGLRSFRVVFSRWYQERTGRPVYELPGDGTKLHWTELPRQCRPLRPKRPDDDFRYRASCTPLSWILEHSEVEEWLASRFWQQARSQRNPHQYTLRRWGDETDFELVVLHIREFGYEAVFGREAYTQYDANEAFHWTMGFPLATTKVINRKPLPGSEAEERLL